MSQPSFRARSSLSLVLALLSCVAGCGSLSQARSVGVEGAGLASAARDGAGVDAEGAAPSPQVALPLQFVENRGQLPADVVFAARSGGLRAEVQADGVTLTLLGAPRTATLVLRFEGASPEATPVAEGPSSSRVHIYRGAQPEAWLTDIPAYGAVRWQELQPGVDVVLRDAGGRLEYDLILAPGAHLADVVVALDGALDLSLGADGALLARTEVGTLAQDIPATWQVLPDGTRQPLDAHFVLLGGQRFGFEAPGRDPERELVLDPGLTYSSYLGGANRDHVNAIARGPGSSVYLAGYTTSANFPTTPGSAQRTLDGYGDAFVARMDLATGALLWSTYLGGNDGVIFVEESARALAVDAGGAAWIAGAANSPDFPVTPGAWQPNLAGSSDGFVAKLEADGTLALCTYLGGAKDDIPTCLALGNNGVFVAGRTFSDGAGVGLPFPTTAGAADTSFNSIFFTDDVFVTRLALTGSLTWSTLLGGVLRDEAQALAVDAAGAVTVTGLTGSSDFPTTAGAYDTSFNGSSSSKLDAFVTRVSPAGNAFTWSTYFGGAESDEGRGLALAADGGVMVAGVTESGNFPATAGAVQTLFGGGLSDAFVARLTGDGSTLTWASLLGGSGTDAANALALDAAGQPTLAGETTSANFPVTAGSMGAGNAGGSDAFLARFAANGAALRSSGTFGGSGDDSAAALALDVHGAGLIAGETSSTNLPVTSGAFDASSNGGGDAFVARVNLPPWADLGKGKAGTAGKQPLLVGTGSLLAGSPGAFTLTNARPNSLMFLFIGLAAGNVPFKGGTLVPFPLFLTVQLGTLADGSFPLGFAAWPSGLPAGFALYFQEWIADPGATNGASATNAVQATQP